jgi:hypothetical protein
MGLFAVAPYVNGAILRKLTDGGLLVQNLYRERGLYWWNAFALAGLSAEWDWFVTCRNQGRCVRQLLIELRDKTTEEEWTLFSHRLGKEKLNPNQYARHRGSPKALWTKGGNWWASSGFTQLLVLKNHLPQRVLDLPFKRSLGDVGIQQIERELMAIVDPDFMLAPEARAYACDYVLYRVPQLTKGWPTKHTHLSPKHLPWFFNCRTVPYGTKGYYYWAGSPRPNRLVGRSGEAKQWAW